MKKIVLCLLALALCLSTAAVSFADQVAFVPSISYKPAPELVKTEPSGHETCVVVTPVAEADTSDKISDADAAILKTVYEELRKDGVKLSEKCAALTALVQEKLGENKTADDLVVRDLFDVSVVCGELETLLGEDGALKLTFKSTVAKGEAVFAMVYVDGRWEPVKDAVNNNDGTITLTFTKLCPVAIMVPSSVGSDDAQTGESTDTTLWIALMGTSAAAMVALMLVYRRRAEEK